jgi:hypothetical protein
VFVAIKNKKHLSLKGPANGAGYGIEKHEVNGETAFELLADLEKKSFPLLSTQAYTDCLFA